MIKTMKTIVRITFSNGITLVCFEIFYKLLGFVFLFPLLQSIFSAFLRIAGIPFLSQENVTVIFKNWHTSFTFLAAVLLLVLYLYYEITAHVYYCELGWKGENCSLWKLCKNSFIRSIKILHYKNILLLILLPFMALSFFPITGWLLQMIKIPEFIMDFIVGNPYILSVYAAGIIIINAVLFFYLFGIPAMVINGEAFFDSWRISCRLLKGNKKKTIKVLLVSLALLAVSYLILFLGTTVLLANYAKYLYIGEEAVYFFQYQYVQWSRIGKIVLTTFGMVFLFASVVTLFYQYFGEKEPKPRKRSWSVKKLGKQGILVIGTFIILAIFSETEMAGKVFRVSESNPIIVAHRAGGLTAPENTQAALKQAIHDKADMAEIDVQQTKDGKLIIMHDTNFKRVAGVDKEVWNTEYKEVQTFDAGNYFSPQKEKEPVPTLENMLIQAKDKIQLMIELKITGHETNLEKKTLDTIKKYGMEKQTIICSMNLNTLKEVKKLEPNIKTVYITAVLMGEQYNLDYINGYSVETSFLTTEMVLNAHAQNKEIYGWTANSEDTINKIIYSEADGIVTDNVELAHFCIAMKGKDILLEDLTDFFFHEQE